jgi:hypothetical protein
MGRTILNIVIDLDSGIFAGLVLESCCFLVKPVPIHIRDCVYGTRPVQTLFGLWCLFVLFGFQERWSKTGVDF